MLSWLWGLLFGDDSDTQTKVLEDAVSVIFSPRLGHDKAKMLKELESILGKEGCNVVKGEEIASLRMGGYFLSEQLLGLGMESVFEEYASNNRGRNGDLITILSKSGVNKLSKFGNIVDDRVLDTAHGWRVYLKDANLIEAARLAFTRTVLGKVKTYMKSCGKSEYQNFTIPCQSCGQDWGWDLHSGTAHCGFCGFPVKDVDYEWAEKVFKDIKEFEEANGVSIMPKEMKAA